jgi:two-component system cell cycle sensor histidine kinase/response regulator CckA
MPGMLAAAWAGLLVPGGVLFFLVPRQWSPWVFSLFWFLGVVLAVLTFLRLKKQDRRLDLMACQADLADEVFWAVDATLCLTAVCGAVTTVTGRAASALDHVPLTSLLTREKAKALEINVKQGAPFSMEADIQKPGGRSFAVEILGRPLPGGQEEVFAGVIRDLEETKRQDRHLREMKVQLERSEKLKNLGLLAGSVAHDLNNILSGIATYPEVLLMDTALDPKTRQGIEMIRTSGRKASSVVSDLLTISRGARADQQVLNLNTVVQRYTTAAEFEKIEQTYPDVEIEINLEPELLNMRGSYIHVEKAVMNLMLNAVEETAGREGGLVRLTTANHYADEDTEVCLAPGEYVMLSVEDNGSGIPEAFLDKVFDPFFTQKEMGKSGTGLGLTVVRNTVQDHKGEIRVASDANGTRFDLFFKGLREELPKTEDPNSLDEIRGSGETILIVDDLASQRKIGATILTNLGYEVFTAADGMAALDFVRERSVDLLVLDMIMAPGISGLETYKRIKAVRPDQKAIIASGHPESEDVLKTQELGAGSFVKKPYTVMDMGIAVKEELET